ncbi:MULTISPECIES: FkbM family methyltransferase [Pannonibacter]|uniref:FkbM family methyltransferase n=1 Tax=Pannonibacter TaxID=227873 RepID=UPI000F020A50|nr:MULTISPECIES: FkbM family methyltransferase [Pannonibacter]
MDLTRAPICVDKASGAISDATPVEHAGLVLTRMAAKALRPLDDLGFSHAARLIRCLLPSRRKVAVRFTQDMTFCFPYGDGYWGLLLDPRDTYEEEVEALLLAVKDCEYAFIDCGANYGYWSLKVTSERFGRHKAAAIELDPASFALLEANVAANGGRVTCLNRAVAGRDDDVLRFYGAKHEARSVVPQAGVEPKGEVLSVTLDRLVDDGHIPQEGPLVLKLDVEGIEIEALRGGVALLMRDVLVIYEEHGSDRSHAVSRYLREDCGMRLFGHAGHDFFELGPLGELDRIKTNRRRGYDFFATRSRFWLDRLESLARG